jgi:hypothetical protein
MAGLVPAISIHWMLSRAMCAEPQRRRAGKGAQVSAPSRPDAFSLPHPLKTVA